MQRSTTTLGLSVGLMALLGACGYVDAYEEAVHDWEPTYCYQSIGKAVCFRQPYHRDERRLVSYFGPHPSRFDRPEAPAPEAHGAPPAVDYWVKDAEPVPRPAPTGRVSQLPWLDPAYAEAEADRVHLTALGQSPDGTRALLRRLGIGPDGALSRPAWRPAPATGTAAPEGAPEEARAASSTTPVPTQPAPPAVPVPPVVEVEVN